METFNWYSRIIKPSWSPPAWIFSPVWTFLYALIAFSFGKVFWLTWQGRVSLLVALPFVLNLVFNFAFTPIQFGLKNNLLASIDILLVLGTLVWAMVAIFPYARWVTYINIPYLLWVSFATILQLTITYLNR
ncbi:MAG TPA: tryptophan-rich sensory protein [Candidatus Paceibacterota bacterium]|nr:tryptophan-rich sensory protein [Candidatus Paceibacterota bacterium]